MRDPSCGSRVPPWYRFPRFESPALLMRLIWGEGMAKCRRRPPPPPEPVEQDRIRRGSRGGTATGATWKVRNPAAIHDAQPRPPHILSTSADNGNRRASETKFPQARAAEEKPSAYTRGRVPLSAVPGDSMSSILKPARKLAPPRPISASILAESLTMKVVPLRPPLAART
jgi:hypothetical protein